MEKKREEHIDYRLGHMRLSEEEIAKIRAKGGVSEEEWYAKEGRLDNGVEAGAYGFDDGVVNGVIIPALVKRTIDTVEEIEKKDRNDRGGDGTSTRTEDDKERTPIIVEGLPKPVPVGCLPVTIITIALATSIGSCDFKGIHIPNLSNPFEYTRLIESDKTHLFKEEYIEVNGPQDNATGLTGLKGQEGLTNNVMAGEENPIEGEYYSGEEHFEDERLSATGLDEFKASQAQVRKDMKDLAEEDLTQDEIKEKLKSIETETQKMEQQYAEREELMEEGVQEFKDATMVNQDSISEIESEVAEQMKEIFDQEHERVSDNLEEIQDLADRAEDGQEVQIEDVEYDEETGKYTISGESIEKVVEEQRYTGIQAIWEGFKDWVRGEPQKGIDDNQR